MAQIKHSDIENIVEMLSPLERKVIIHINQPYKTIQEKSGLDQVSLSRALKFLESKGIIKLNTKSTKIVDLGTNGIYYKKNHLPERNLLILLEKHRNLALVEAKKLSKLSENEFKVSLGVLKGKALINLINGKLSLNASKDELVKKTFEEQLLEVLPKEYESLPIELKHAFETLKKRKEIIEITERKEVEIVVTELGNLVSQQKIDLNLLEEVTPELIKSGAKGKKFRKYDIQFQVPRVNGGKKHFVNQSIEYAKSIWMELGFKEMKGSLIDTSFWVFDALFTPQDHPAREMQDTFFIEGILGKLPEKKIVDGVRKAHESGISGSAGWNYAWDPEVAKKLLLRTHTTNVSARTLTEAKSRGLPAKYFTIGKVFRNETLDWSHLFEFYQTEGIVIDKDVNFRHLLGYLKEFYKKMGFEEIKFVPSFFAYTEPSVEVHVFHPERKIWFELGGAGVFRPEVTAPLLGPDVKVLAWGQGYERIIMDYYKIKNLRDMYSNDLKGLRSRKRWVK